MQKPHPEREAGLQVAELSRLEGILCAHALRCWHWAPGEGFGPVFASCEYLSTLASVLTQGPHLGSTEPVFLEHCKDCPPCPQRLPQPFPPSNQIALCLQGPPDPGPQLLNIREAFLGTKNATYLVSQIGSGLALRDQRL